MGPPTRGPNMRLRAPAPSLPQIPNLAAPPSCSEAGKGVSFEGSTQGSGLEQPRNHEPGWVVELFSKSRA